MFAPTRAQIAFSRVTQVKWENLFSTCDNGGIELCVIDVRELERDTLGLSE